MFYTFAQLLDLILNSRIHPLFVFSSYCWVVWLTKYTLSMRYKPYNNPTPQLTTTAIIPAYREHPQILNECLKSLKKQGVNQVILVIDQPTVQEISEIDHTLINTLIINTKRMGKRHAIKQALEHAKGDVVIIVDSDTIMGENALNALLTPFKDPEIGGVCTIQRVAPPLRKIHYRFADWMEDLRWTFSAKAQSVFGQLGCLPGRAIAIRRELLQQIVDDNYVHEAVIGDDRAITVRLQKLGYKTFYQATGTVYTRYPEGWWEFLRQQLRWARSSQYYTLKNLKLYLTKCRMAGFVFITDILTPLGLMFILVWAAINAITHFYPCLVIQGTPLATTLGIPIGVAGMASAMGVKWIPHLRKNKRDLLILPLFALFLTLVLTPIRVLGLLTCYKTREWLSR